ncbi:MAG: NUDIX hydrolase [Eubacteriales bacterium]|nr:NUDIX hydrolase [Eubacteriales bacterium]
MENGFKILQEETVYKGVRAHVVVQKMQLPDGSTANWDMIRHSGAAAVVPIDENGKIIMTRQYRSSIDGESLEIPAGVLDVVDGVKEEPLKAAARELEEETGYYAEELHYLLTYGSTIGLCDEMIYIYYAKDLKLREQHLDEGEYIDVERYELSDLLDMIAKGELVDGKSIAGILAYARQAGM